MIAAMGSRARYGWAFGLTAAVGLAGQTLLFLERQAWKLEGSLREDLRVVLFLHAGPEDSKVKVIEEKLRAMPEVAEVRFVAADEALAALKREDPELVESVALLDENPLPGAFEVRPAPEALPRLAAWVSTVRPLAEWFDIRYKPGQVQAILTARFYAHLLKVVLSALLCAGAALALSALSSGLRHAHSPRAAARGALAGALGAAAGALLAAGLAWPLRRLELLWAWPAASAQLTLLASGALIGWSLPPWRDEA